MKIAIIGAGNVGATLGCAWMSRGHEIFYGVSNPDDQKHSALKSQDKTEVTTNQSAANEAELVAFATPWSATESAVKACGNLGGKVVVDCTNPLTKDFSGLAVGHSISGTELVAQWAAGAHVVKTMNQIGYSLMDSPQLVGGKPSMFLCGDSLSAKTKVRGLVEELGFEAIDAGDLSVARLVEPLAMLWIHLAMKQGMGTEFGFGILRSKRQESA